MLKEIITILEILESPADQQLILLQDIKALPEQYDDTYPVNDLIEDFVESLVPIKTSSCEIEKSFPHLSRLEGEVINLVGFEKFCLNVAGLKRAESWSRIRQLAGMALVELRAKYSE